MTRYRVKDYSFVAGSRSIDTGLADLTVDDIVKIVNSTSGRVITNTAIKGTIASVEDGVVTYRASTVITLGGGVQKTYDLPVLGSGDVLYIEVDFGGSAMEMGVITEQQINDMVARVISQN